jgi:hypothetical protein
VTCSSEASANFYQTAQCYIPENSTLQNLLVYLEASKSVLFLCANILTFFFNSIRTHSFILVLSLSLTTSHETSEWWNVHYVIISSEIFLQPLTPWRRAFLEKLIVTQLLKTFHVFYGTQGFITVFARAHHWSLTQV